MRVSWRRRISCLLLVLIGSATLATLLGGCASSMRIESAQSLPMPAEMSAPQSPGANDYLKKAQVWLESVSDYFNETPQFTMP